ncbi:hypothetical protein BW716_25295 [[Flexibacter] sp. ATCC 35208]|nr:hypothetical protein BW716_25295 [[Flexibacter] sp. ATCC 35208]
MYSIPIPIFCCLLGAIAVQLVKFIDDSRLLPEDRPNYLSPLYYIRGGLMLLLAAIFGYIYFEDETIGNKVIYFHTGATAPIIVRAMVNALPTSIMSRIND